MVFAMASRRITQPPAKIKQKFDRPVVKQAFTAHNPDLENPWRRVNLNRPDRPFCEISSKRISPDDNMIGARRNTRHRLERFDLEGKMRHRMPGLRQINSQEPLNLILT